jgi:uncharacterized protein (DUF1800 family)
MAVLTAITSWTVADVQHFARRAGFGLSPVDAAALQAQAPGPVIDAWIDGTGPTHDLTAFTAALATADMVTEPKVTANTTDPGSVDVALVAAPHPFLIDAPNAWRNNLNTAQAYLAWRMQHNPYAFQERMALFYHNLFATGWHKVNNAAFMLKQIELFRTDGLDRFDDLLVKVSKDPAMCVWLDSILNNASGTSIPNENYARESMELYSLGADNGYSQADITQLALALSGWSFTFGESDYVPNPASPSSKTPADGHFRVYDGTVISPDTRLWYGGTTSTGKTGNMHHSSPATITLFGQTVDITTTAGGWAKGENALRSIVSVRGTNCAQFLAKRLLTHFVTTGYASTDQDDVAAMIQSAGFDMRAVMKTLLKSQFFFDPANHWTLAEGPVSWIVRGAKMLCPPLTEASAQTPKGYPAWRLFANNANTFDQMGMRLLDPNGPNGWHEHAAWLNSNTMRYRTKAAAALALLELNSSIPLFPTSVTTDWFPTAPTTAQAVYDRLVLMLQPGPIPTSVSAGWLAALLPSPFTWNAASQTKARELAFLILCSPSGQLY